MSCAAQQKPGLGLHNDLHLGGVAIKYHRPHQRARKYNLEIKYAWAVAVCKRLGMQTLVGEANNRWGEVPKASQGEADVPTMVTRVCIGPKRPVSRGKSHKLTHRISIDLDARVYSTRDTRFED